MVTENDILELDFDCKPVSGDKERLYSEIFIHGEVYRGRPDIKSVVHTHAPAVILMGISGETLMPMYQMTGYMGRRAGVRYSQGDRPDQHAGVGSCSRQGSGESSGG